MSNDQTARLEDVAQQDQERQNLQQKQQKHAAPREKLSLPSLPVG